MTEELQNQIAAIVRENVRKVGCIYPTIGNAIYDEPLDRLALMITDSISKLLDSQFTPTITPTVESNTVHKTCKDTCCFDCIKFESGRDCEDETTMRFTCSVMYKGNNDCLACKDIDEPCWMFVRK
jgi:hypothetical protein